MLTENDVIEAVCKRLGACGFTINRRAATHQRGIDVVASGRDLTVLVEAKGETSSRQSHRFGKPFTRNQTRTHVAVAFLTAAQLLHTTLPGAKRKQVAIALPDNQHHRDMVQQVSRSLRVLRISVIWVGAEGTVTCQDRWLRARRAKT